MKIDSVARALASHRRTRLRGEEFPGYLRAAVLIPLVETPEGLSLILTVRTHDVESHKGQISFPGGVAESSDADEIATALREAHEEIGLPDSAVRILGLLDDYPVPSGYIVTPVAGYLSRMPVLTPHPGEVSEIFTVPLRFFADAGNGRTEPRTIGGKTFDVWYFQAGPHLVWGATAMIIRALVDRVEGSDALPPP
jgi:8-oxo-dGTP pyrophosphatase MutT (NUDIX family)